MNRIISILVVTVCVGQCLAQDVDTKNYRLSFIAGIDYSRIVHQINLDYTTTINPGTVNLTGAGKMSGGMGIRLEYNYESRTYFMVSAMMLDKGFSIYYEWTGLNNENLKEKNRYRELYLSLPFEVIFRLGSKKNSLYLKGGLSFDIDIERKKGYSPMGNSLVAGIGKSFLINEVLLLSIEPTFRYSVYNYGERVSISNDKSEKYRPVSLGIMICLSQ